jgi:urease gamma subunit
MADLARQNEFKPSQLSSIIGDLAQPIFQRLESASPFLPPPCQSPTTNRRPGLVQGPEVTFLGLANYRTILQAALKEDVDVVLMFSVDERTTRSGKKSKTVSFSVRDAWTGREIQRESRLNYLQHETNRTDPLYEDPIDKIAAQFQSVLLEDLKPGPFPQELRSDVASRRVAALAKLNHPDPLPVLAEMKLYRLLNLVSVQELLDASQSILESKTGTELVAGTMDEKRAAIESWIPDLRMELSEQARRQAARAADNDDD